MSTQNYLFMDKNTIQSSKPVYLVLFPETRDNESIFAETTDRARASVATQEYFDSLMKNTDPYIAAKFIPVLPKQLDYIPTTENAHTYSIGLSWQNAIYEASGIRGDDYVALSANSNNNLALNRFLEENKSYFKKLGYEVLLDVSYEGKDHQNVLKWSK